MPAGGIANPHPGGFGTPLGRQKDRSAGSPLDWTSVRQAKLLLLPRPRKRGSGAESAGYGRFGECRGEAPEGERAPVWRASAQQIGLRRLRRLVCGAHSDGDVWMCGADSGRHAPFGAPPPSLLRMILSENRTPLFGIMREPEANQRGFVVVVVGKTRTRWRRENEFLCPPLRTRVFPSSAIFSGRSRKHPTSGAGRGRVSAANEGEGGQMAQICKVSSPSPASHLRCSAPSPHWGEGARPGRHEERRPRCDEKSVPRIGAIRCA